MKKAILTLAAAVFTCAAANAIEMNWQPGKKVPGADIFGKVQKDAGTSVLVKADGYYFAILKFKGEKDAGGNLELELATTGNPASQLGIILYERDAKKKLQRVVTPAWAKNISKDKYTKMTFKIAPKTFKAGKNYEMYLYRSNQKGTLKLKSLIFKTTHAAK